MKCDFRTHTTAHSYEGMTVALEATEVALPIDWLSEMTLALKRRKCDFSRTGGIYNKEDEMRFPHPYNCALLRRNDSGTGGD